MTDATPVAPPTSDPAPSKVPVKKVAASGIVAAVLVVIVGVIAGLTPASFEPLGVWGPVIYAAVVAVGGFLAGYIKKA